MTKFYYRVCEGVNDIGKFVEFTPDSSKFIKNNKKDYYRSIYLYTEEQKVNAEELIDVKKNGKTYKRAKGVSGITEVTTPELVWDFDCKEDISKAKQDTKTLVERLENVGMPIDHIGVYFSGNKGFAVHIMTDSSFTPEKFKAITGKLAEGLQTYDSVVSNPSRLIRIPQSVHLTSGLYKTRLDVQELELDDDEIRGIAAEQYENEPLKVVSVSKDISEIEPEVKEKSENVTVFDRVNPAENPLNLSPWKLALLQGFFPPGQRSNALMILASTLKSKGFDEDSCYSLLKSTIRKQAARYDQDIFSKEEFYNNIISQVYGSLWDGGTYSEDNFPKALVDYFDKIGVQRANVKDFGAEHINDVYDVFEDYARNIDANTIKLGIPKLDKIVRITTSMLVGVLASPAGGKTATILNILNNMSLTGEESMFFSMDMGKPLVYQKMAQKLLGIEADELFEIFAGLRDEEGEYVKLPDEIKKQRIKNTLADNYENVKLVFDTAADPDKMREIIINHEKNTGKKVRLIAVDYLEKIPGPHSDATANSGWVAKKLQSIANDLQLCVIVLLQPQKLAGDPRDPIRSYRKIKGASLLEQDCRVIISLWREGYDTETFENDNFITYAVLKNTMGKLGEVDCYWDGLTGSVDELDDSGRIELASLRKAKAQKKAMEDNF